MHGRNLVIEEVLGVGQFPLSLGETALPGEHRSERRRGIRSEPAATARDVADDRFRLLGVAPGGLETSAVGGNECERRPGNAWPGSRLSMSGCWTARKAAAHAWSSSPAR